MADVPSQTDIAPARRVIRRRRPGRWAATIVIILIAAYALKIFITTKEMQWPVVGQYMFNRTVIEGVGLTAELTLTSMAIGILLGLLVALMRLSQSVILRSCAFIYIWILRSIPVLVQMIFWFNIAIVFPRAHIVLPFGIAVLNSSTNSVISPLIAANLGLGLAEGAYMAEIFRGGILSVDQGQAEAADALGLRQWQKMRQVVLPQAIRVIIPTIGNQFIGMLKYTSLASVISVTELLEATQIISQRTFAIIPLLIVASAWYIILTTALSVPQQIIERRFNRRHISGFAMSRWIGSLLGAGDGGESL